MKPHVLTSIMVAAIMASAFSAPAFAQNEERVKFAVDIEYIKGHLQQAVANKQVENATLAKVHAGHPVAEVYSLVEGEIQEHNALLNTQLKDALMGLPDQVDSLTFSEFQTEVAEINDMLDQASESVLSETERNNATFSAMVIISLLETAEHEYKEAVEGGAVTEIIEYQDALGFIGRAQVIFESIRAQVPEHEAQEIDEFFEDLDERLSLKAEYEEVETLIGGIVHELEEAFSLEEVVQIDGQAYIDTIQALLNETLAEYKAGEYQEARDLAIEAYLDNFEYIEDDIKADDPDLMLKIELELSRELVDMIDERRSVADVESHITTIRSDLEQARTVVVPEFSLAAGVGLALVAAIILSGTFYVRRKGFAPSV